MVNHISQKLLTKWQGIAANIKGVSEETTTGVVRLYQMLEKGEHFPAMNGKTVFVHAVKKMAESLSACLSEASFKIERPGPIKTTSYFLIFCHFKISPAAFNEGAPALSLKGKVIASGKAAVIIPRSQFGHAIVTSPAPAFNTALPAKIAAPLMPFEPAIIKTFP